MLVLYRIHNVTLTHLPFKVIDQILKEDQMELPRRAGPSRVGEAPLPPDMHRPRGIFNKLMISPDEWRQVRDLIKILQVHLSLSLFRLRQFHYSYQLVSF